MKEISNYMSLILLAAFLNGCAGIAPGENEVIVNAERTVKLTEIAIETFLELEYENRLALWSIDHEIKHYADTVRLNQGNWILGAYESILIWKDDESEGNLNDVKIAIRILDQVQRDIQKFQVLEKLNANEVSNNRLRIDVTHDLPVPYITGGQVITLEGSGNIPLFIYDKSRTTQFD